MAADPRIALVLGGGAARGLAHIGALEVLENAGLAPDIVIGSSMGGLVAALSAAGLRAGEIRELARGFRFPSWFIPGGIVTWDRIFPTAVAPLEPARFEALPRRLAVVAVDLESGRRAVLTEGPVLPAVRATCAVPGVLPPIQIGGRWLVDGGLVSVLPVDVAGIADPDVTIAIEVGAPRERRLPSLAAVGWGIGRVFPNPLTARSSFEVLVRAAEIALDRQNTLAAAMIGPEVLVRVDMGDFGLRDFQRVDEAAAAGRRAMEDALPELRAALESPRDRGLEAEHGSELHLDPVCDMIVNARRAGAVFARNGHAFYFCSTSCRDAFLRAVSDRESRRVVLAPRGDAARELPQRKRPRA